MAACPTLARFNRSVIPNCVDSDTFKAFDRRTSRALNQVPEESFCIATVADSLIKERKGIRVLLQAFKCLIESSELSRIHLLLIGPQPGDTSTIIPDEFLSTTNTLQSDSAVAVALAAADALVIPSLQDNLPLVWGLPADPRLPELLLYSHNPHQRFRRFCQLHQILSDAHTLPLTETLSAKAETTHPLDYLARRRSEKSLIWLQKSDGDELRRS